MKSVKYKIRHSRYYFCTGTAKGGNQYLIGLQLPNLVLVSYDNEGNMSRLEERPAKDLDSVYEESLEWLSELGAIIDSIEVKQFYVQDKYIGIKCIPAYLQDYLDNPSIYDEENRDEYDKQHDDWKAAGNYVLQWAEEYWMNKEGEVEST